MASPPLDQEFMVNVDNFIDFSPIRPERTHLSFSNSVYVGIEALEGLNQTL